MSFTASLESLSPLAKILISRKTLTFERENNKVTGHTIRTLKDSPLNYPSMLSTKAHKCTHTHTHLEEGIADSMNVMLRRITRHNQVL